MIVVTGGAGFIGSNLIKQLNARGREDIVLVEDLAQGEKTLNLSDCVVADYFAKDHFLRALEEDANFDFEIDAVFHLGACSDTTEWDGAYMMETNFRFSKALFNFCVERKIPLVYASSAAVYGGGNEFAEIPANERPLNAYGYSKLAFDQFVRHRLSSLDSLVIGLRYFNVYGPRESHKKKMASVVWHFNRQLIDTGVLRLFEGSHGYDNGGQLRDFVHVDDVVDVTLWCATQDPGASGIYNCGTGVAASFNDVAKAIVNWHGRGDLSYIPFPPDLLAAYQAFTEADLSRLRAIGYGRTFRDVASGVREYLTWLDC